MAEKKTIHLSIPGRESIELDIQVEASGAIKEAQLRGVGSLELLNALAEYRSNLKGALKDLPVPKGTSTAMLMLSEVILKAKGEWKYPFEEEETCHCRAVPTEKITQAILVGAHTPRAVSEMTSASTACGTCRPDVEAMIEYRLKAGA